MTTSECTYALNVGSGASELRLLPAVRNAHREQHNVRGESAHALGHFVVIRPGPGPRRARRASDSFVARSIACHMRGAHLQGAIAAIRITREEVRRK